MILLDTLSIVGPRKPIREQGEDLRTLPTYTLPEAAAFLAIPESTLYAWFRGPRNPLEPAGHAGSISLLSFRDLTEAYALQLLRKKGVNMRDIRLTLQDARQETQSQHPLLHPNTRVFLGNLIVPAKGESGLGYVDVSRGRQIAISEVVEAFGERILFDDNELAREIRPWRRPVAEPMLRPVSIDPDVASGRLVVVGTRIPVQVLQRHTVAGKSPRYLADEYGISVELVRQSLSHIGQATQKAA